jgi:hypothetical protein
MKSTRVTVTRPSLDSVFLFENFERFIVRDTTYENFYNYDGFPTPIGFERSGGSISWREMLSRKDELNTYRPDLATTLSEYLIAILGTDTPTDEQLAMFDRKLSWDPFDTTCEVSVTYNSLEELTNYTNMLLTPEFISERKSLATTTNNTIREQVFVDGTEISYSQNFV